MQTLDKEAPIGRERRWLPAVAVRLRPGARAADPLDIEILDASRARELLTAEGRVVCLAVLMRPGARPLQGTAPNDRPGAVAFDGLELHCAPLQPGGQPGLCQGRLQLGRLSQVGDAASGPQYPEQLTRAALAASLLDHPCRNDQVGKVPCKRQLRERIDLVILQPDTIGARLVGQPPSLIHSLLIGVDPDHLQTAARGELPGETSVSTGKHKADPPINSCLIENSLGGVALHARVFFSGIRIQPGSRRRQGEIEKIIALVLCRA